MAGGKRVYLPCMLLLALRVMVWAGCNLSCAGNWYRREISASVVLPTIRARIFYTARDGGDAMRCDARREGTNRGRTDP